MSEYVGVDVASKTHVAYSEELGWEKLENKRAVLKVFLRKLPAGTVLGVESTGGYGTLLAEMAHGAGFTVYVLQPAKVKRFRESGPDKGKTDKIDARAICEYLRAYEKRLHPYNPLPEFEAKLRKLSRTREGIVKKLASLRTLLRSLNDKSASIHKTLAPLEARVAELTSQIKQMLDQAPDANVLASISCVKTNAIASALPALRTIPFKNKYAFDSFAGMDLTPCESGKKKGARRMSKAGDKHIRRAFYMCALSATNSKAWKGYYQMLLTEKKLKKIQAINALARKILHTVFAVYRSQTPFVARI